MEEKETKQGHPAIQGAVITIGAGLILLTAVAIGLLLLVIGAGIRSRGVVLAGEFIFPLSLFAGGLFWGEEKLPVRITLIAVGGLFVIAALSASSSFLIP
jgi:hypothetical protein